MIYRIPFQPNKPHQKITTKLGEAIVDLTLTYNSISQLFSLSLTSNTFSLAGVPFVLGQDFLAPYSTPSLGHLFGFCQSVPHHEPTLENVGVSTHLAWVKAEDDVWHS